MYAGNAKLSVITFQSPQALRLALSVFCVSRVLTLLKNGNLPRKEIGSSDSEFLMPDTDTPVSTLHSLGDHDHDLRLLQARIACAHSGSF